MALLSPTHPWAEGAENTTSTSRSGRLRSVDHACRRGLGFCVYRLLMVGATSEAFMKVRPQNRSLDGVGIR